MKRLSFIIVFLMAAFCAFGQNPTQVRPTNGIENATAQFTGKVIPRLKTNGIGAGKVYSSVDGGPANFQWISLSAGGITTLNGLTNSTQTFAVGTSGTDFAISSSGSTHTFNLPIASGVNTGKLSATDWTTFNNKVSSSRTINTTAPLTGGGDLSANRTFAMPAAGSGTNGYLLATDWATFNGKQAAVSVAANNVLFSTTGSNITGSNAFNMIFNGTGSLQTNAAGGAEIHRASAFAWGTNNASLFFDYYWKGLITTDAFCWEDSTIGGTATRMTWTGNGSGLATWKMFRVTDSTGCGVTYNGHSDNYSFFNNRQGNNWLTSPSGSSAGLGSWDGSTLIPGFAYTNGINTAYKNINGGANLITNFANLYPKSASWSPFDCDVISGGAIAVSLNTLRDLNAMYSQNTGGTNDTTRWFCYLAEGTDYTFNTEFEKDSNVGIMTLLLINYNGTTTNTLGTIDGYSAVVSRNQTGSIPFTNTVGGKVEFRMQMKSKNASSSGFFWDPERYNVKKGS